MPLCRWLPIIRRHTPLTPPAFSLRHTFAAIFTPLIFIRHYLHFLCHFPSLFFTPRLFFDDWLTLPLMSWFSPPV